MKTVFLLSQYTSPSHALLDIYADKAVALRDVQTILNHHGADTVVSKSTDGLAHYRWNDKDTNRILCTLAEKPLLEAVIRK